MKYVVSGIGFDNSGVGRVMQFIRTIHDEERIIVPILPINKSVKTLVKKLMLLEALKIYIHNKTINLRFRVRIWFLKNKELIIIHPQSLGLKTFINISSKNKVSLYVMDNSFFCRNSYNYLQGDDIECFKCLGGNLENAHKNKCSAPIYNSKEDYEKFYNYLILNYRKINFFVQNLNQKHLLKLHLGNDVNVRIIGLLTIDMFENKEKNIKKDNQKDNQKIIVYHGDLNVAKGILYIINLSRYIEKYKFLIPFSKEKVEKVFGNKISNSNINFKEMSWETGLKEQVKNADLVICPSMWSAPIEGALIKSLLLNTNVAVIKREKSFSGEIDKKYLMFLSGIYHKDKVIIEEYFENNYHNHPSEKWILENLEKTREMYVDVFSEGE